MTTDQFISRYLGKIKGYPTDSQYLGQCLSIVKLYIKECFGIDPPPSGTNSAYGYWSNFPNPLGTVFKKVPDTLDLIPEYGWIVIWKPWDTNEYGHIAIVDKGCTKTVLKNIAQNWTSKIFQRESQNYNNVKGYLVPTTQNDMTDIVKKYGCKTIEELDSKIFEHVGLDWGNENNLENKSYLASDRRKNKSLQAELEKKQAEIEQVKGEVVEKASALKTVREELKEFIETLASKLVTIADKSEIIGAIDRLLDNEDKLKKNISQLEKAYSLLESEKKEEITSLKEAIATMKSEYEKALKRVETLEKRVEELETSNNESETEKAVFTRIEKLIEIIKGLFNDKTKTK